jgi:hypothetical protein
MSSQQPSQQPIGTPRPNPSAAVFVPGELDNLVPMVATERYDFGVQGFDPC